MLVVLYPALEDPKMTIESEKTRLSMLLACLLLVLSLSQLTGCNRSSESAPYSEFAQAFLKSEGQRKQDVRIFTDLYNNIKTGHVRIPRYDHAVLDGGGFVA